MSPSLDRAGAADSCATSWARALQEWRIPEEILAAAPQSPWVLPVELFVADPEQVVQTPSVRRAVEVLPEGGSVLDVGCGGGRAAYALTPPGATVIGVDRSPAMLEAFASVARSRGLDHLEITGDWPDVAGATPTADVAVCHHVAYNVAQLAPFALALSERARRRVVLELPDRHPLSYTAPLWQHFWGVTRPQRPTAQDAHEVLVEAGLPARLELWDDQMPRPSASLPWARQVELMRIRLCLPAERDGELSGVMKRLGRPAARRVATIWWEPA